MRKSETQSFRHGNYLEMAAFPLQETRGNVLISCRDARMEIYKPLSSSCVTVDEK